MILWALAMLGLIVLIGWIATAIGRAIGAALVAGVGAGLSGADLAGADPMG